MVFYGGSPGNPLHLATGSFHSEFHLRELGGKGVSYVLPFDCFYPSSEHWLPICPVLHCSVGGHAVHVM